MAAYILKRFLGGLISFLIFTVVLFFGISLLIPGDFVGNLALVLTTREMAELRDALGLDQPLWRQYLSWMDLVVRGNLGSSFVGFGRVMPVTALLQEALGATLLVFATGIIVAFGVGQWLGRVSAWRDKGWAPGGITLSSVVLYTTFPPWLVFLIAFFLVDRLQLLPQVVPGEFTRDLWQGSSLARSTVMMRMVTTMAAVWIVLMLLNAFIRRRYRRNVPALATFIIWLAGVYGVLWLRGYVPYAADILRVAAVPLLAFVLLSFGDTVLMMRTTMADTQHETYVMLARAKGVPEKTVRSRHAARNAILPVLTRFVINLPYLLTGVVIVERAARWPGVGEMLFRAIEQQDTYVYMGVMLVVGLLALAARLVLDVLYVYFDPRIRYAEATVGGER